MIKSFYFPLPAAPLVLVVIVTMLAPCAFAQPSPSFGSGTSLNALHSTTVDAGRITSIPFTQNFLDSLIVVSVQINGHSSMPFLVDTGLDQPAIIEKWAADQLGLVPSTESGKFSSNRKPFPMTTLQSLIIKAKDGDKDIEYNSFPAYISDVELPSSNSQQIAGILGLPLFYQLVMQLDSSQHTINLSKQLDRSQLEPNAAFFPLTQPDPTDIRFFAAWNVVAGTTELTNNLLLDTGASNSSLSQAIVSLVHPSAMSVAAQFNIEGWRQNSCAFVPKIDIGSFAISDLRVRSPPHQQDDHSADAFGMDILQHFRVTLDFPGKQMILDKFDNKPSTSAPTTTGIVLEKRDTGLFVRRVLPRSPAEKASVHVGDQITQVDDQPIIADDDQTAQNLLDGNAGTDAKLLMFSAGGKPRQVTLPRLTLYDPSLYPSYGFLAVKRLSDQAILVGYILCSSPAWNAGIRAGDVLVAVNKIPVKTTDKARSLLASWPQKALALTLRRDDKPLTITLKKMPAGKKPPAANLVPAK